MAEWLKKTLKSNKYFIILIGLMFIFRSAIADWNVVPTGSMKPTILEGDRIFVNKMAYDLRLPFTHISLLKLSDPKRGDIVIFDSAVSGNRLVKRVIGIPGDKVALENNNLFINDQRITYQSKSSVNNSTDKIENLLGIKHMVRIRNMGSSKLSSFPQITIPQGKYLMLGDNRDNSADSRVIGLVPRSEIVGQSDRVVMSLKSDDYYLPRTDRFFHQMK